MSALVKFLGRKGTRGKYDNKVELPTPVEETVTVQTRTQEDKDKEADSVDRQVDTEHQAEDRDANTNTQVADGKKRAVDGVLKHSVATTSSGAPKGVYSRLWKNVTEYKLSPIKYSTSASWIPNTLAAKYILESSAKLVGQSNHAMKHEKEFLPYAYITGMYYLMYIQMLRAQKASGDLSGEDASALGRFEKFNPLEGIMIPEPCIPLLESLAAVKLDDVKYKWIIPNFNLDFTNRTTFAHHCAPQLADSIRPNVVFMLANLATFGATELTDLPTKLDGARRFTPVALGPRNTATGATTVRFLGGNTSFNGAMDAAAAADRRNVLQMHGANTPFQFYNDNYSEAHEGLRNSRFFIANGIDIALTNTALHPETGNALNDGSKTMNSLETYLFIAKRNNPSWFHYLAKQINTVARFFPGSKPMSQIGVIGGIEPSVIAQLKLEDANNFTPTGATAAADYYVYEDMRYGKTDFNSLRYYQDAFRTINASFNTTRGDVHRNEELNSFALATCADPPIYHNYTATDAHPLRKGKFFEDIKGGARHMQVQRLGFQDFKIPGEVPMYHYLDEEFVKPAFSKTPSNDKI